jgi:hypothetical protein
VPVGQMAKQWQMMANGLKLNGKCGKWQMAKQ